MVGVATLPLSSNESWRFFLFHVPIGREHCHMIISLQTAPASSIFVVVYDVVDDDDDDGGDDEHVAAVTIIASRCCRHCRCLKCLRMAVTTSIH